MPQYYQGVTLDEMCARLRENYLTESGWLKSADIKEAVGPKGEPSPWMTYASIEFVARQCRPDMSVFEFGSGGSTLWWKERVKRVVSVEHNSEWAAQTGATCRPADMPADVVALEPYLRAVEARIDTTAHNDGQPDRSFAAYLSALLEAPRHSFDVIVIDGMARNTAALIAADVVKPDGLIIFDNSDRPEYSVGYDALKAAGFARIDFWGLGPINPYGWCTSVFIRTLSALR